MDTIEAKTAMESVVDNIHETENVLLEELRDLRRSLRASKDAHSSDSLTTGQRIADKVASTMGSWPFIIIQSILLLLWIGLNVTAYVKAWDPYPFILLNLALSFQAAYAAPFIMMSQNRQQQIDRKAAEEDYKINIKAELEIELLHHKLDQLRQQEVLNLSKSLASLTDLLNRSGLCSPVDGTVAATATAALTHNIDGLPPA